MDTNLNPSDPDAMPDQAPNSSQPRKWDWIFRALHSVAGRRQNSITLNMPDTVIFTNGQPTKWLTTLADGRLARNLLSVSSTYKGSSRHVRAKAPKMNEIMIHEQIKLVHDAFYKFRSSYEDFNDPVTSPLCIAWYTDGKKELLQSQTLLMLMKHREWRVQVTALQAYVKPKREAKGHFSPVHQIRIGSDDVTEKNAALDIVTKSLATYAERAYAVNTNEEEDEDLAAQSIATPTTLPSSNIKVDTMDAEFIVDASETLWFSHLSNVMVQVVHAKRERKEEMKRMEESKLIEAASVVSNELKRLLRMAANRGVSVAASFSHFDAQGIGYADVNNLIEGLSRLGIGISQPAAEILMGMIGQASSLHFRARDLVIFAELETDDIESDAEDSSSSPSKIKVDESFFDGDYDDMLPATPHSRGPTPASPSRRMHSSQSQQSYASDLPDPEPLDLDYSVDASAAARTNKGPDLPPWARGKSKKAYKELKDAETRYLKKQTVIQGYDDDISSDDSDEEKAGKAKKSPKPLIFPDEVPSVSKPTTAASISSNDSVSSKKSGSLASLTASASIASSTSSMIPGLNLPAGEVPEDPNINLNDADSLFHAQSSIVMSYRIVNAGNRPSPKRRDGATDLQQTAAFNEAKNILERLEPLKERPFKLVVTPDVFMTLDTLEEALTRPLLDQHPLSSILYVGLPGLPNTLWQKGTVLNNETHAECLSNLLNHVELNGEFSSTPPVPTFFLGFGIGAAALNYFATSHFNDDRHRVMKNNTRAFILCNNFSKINQELKRTIQGIRRVFKKDDHAERMQIVMSILFSDEYLEKRGREEAMEEFWTTRSRISLRDETEPKKNLFLMCSGNGKEGVVALLHGMQSGVDTTPNFDLITVPLLMVQASKDNFIAPTNIEVFEQTEEEFAVLPSPRDLLDPPEHVVDDKMINVQWLHCGHEILQERKTAITSLIFKMVEASHDEHGDVKMSNLADLSSRYDNQHNEENKVSNLSDFFDVLDDDMGFEKPSESENNIDLGGESGTLNPSTSLDASSADPTKDGAADVNNLNEASTTSDKTSASIADKQKKKRERRAREAQVRKQREEERKLRKIRDEQAQELKKIRLAEQARLDEVKIQEERHAMHREDFRSSLAEEYFRECEEWEVSAEIARAKAVELQNAREEDEIAELEAEAARQRAKKHEDRNARIAELRKKYLDDELRMDGDKEGMFKKGVANMDTHMAAPYCERLLADLFQCRKRMVDSMKRAKLALEKVSVFQSEYDAIEREVRGLRRTQRLATTNSTFQAIKPSKRELEELKKKLDEKQNALSEIKSLLSGRKDLLDISNRSVQGLKVVLAQKEDETREMIKTLKIREDKMKSNLAVFRVTKDNYSNERDEIEKILQQSKQRLKIVTLELKKVSRHKGKFVDTDVWQKGVMQRMLSVDIREHLEREQTTLNRVLHEFKNTLADVKSGIYKCDRDIKTVMGEIEELKAVMEELTRGWAVAMSKSIAMEFEEQMKNENNAVILDEGTEERKARTKEAMKKKGSLADSVRLKNGEDRTKEEKMWVSMDVILNPEKYSHVSEVEAEEMKFDPDYSIKFEVHDIKRLLNLPSQIQLALPFLYTSLEIRAHQLLTKFTHEQGEQYFKDSDMKSQDIEDEGNSKKLSPEQARAAERKLNVLLKERRAADTRSLPLVEQTEEQRDWTKLDKLLNPHLFVESVKKLDPKEPKIMTASLKVEQKMGDKYEHARKVWEGEADEEWKCPFDDISLREINKETMDDLETDDERYAKFLMDKYHCDDSETRLGEASREALQGMVRVNKQLKEGKKFGPDANKGNLMGIMKNMGRNARGGRGGPGGAAGGGGGGGDDDGNGGGAFNSNDSDEEKKRNDDKDLDESSEDEDNSHKIFGSWFVVHPAAIGKKSQTQNFNPVTYDDHVHHPAMFQYYRLPEEIKKEDKPTIDRLGAVTGHPKKAGWMRSTKDEECKVVKNLDELGKIDYSAVKRGMKVLVTSGKTEEQLSELDCSLESRQSRSHKFFISPSGKDKMLDITVSVVFQGVFGPRGYRLGRLAVQLYRIPSDKEKSDPADGKNGLAAPQPLGYAPYELQILNTPDALGRIVIQHKPRKIPVEPGTFQVVVGAAAASKYSIQVTGTLGEDAETVLNREFESSMKKQSRLTECSNELNELWTSMRLAERKISVCQGLIEEAESESSRCESDIEMCNNELSEDDELMEMTEEERNDVFREIKVLEVEFSHWCKLFATRTQEKKDIKEGLEHMAEMRRARLKEKENLKTAMEKIRQIIPSATASILGPGRATEVALKLNAPLNLGGGNASSRWQAISAVKNMITSSLTPAEEVRRLYQREGFKALTLEERQWSMLDRIRNEVKWEWLKIKEEEEDRAREARGAKAKKRKYNAAIEQFRIDKSEIDRIAETSFSKLQRREVVCKKLLNKYHDDAEMMKRKAEMLSSGFDPHLAAEVRAKFEKTWTPTEKEWVTVDKILNPSAWVGRVKENAQGFDRHRGDSNLIELTEEEMREAGEADKEKMDKIGKLLGSGGGGFGNLVKQASKTKRSKQNDKPLGKWVCAYSRVEILKIWSAKNGEDLKSNDEERCWKLLKNYNGDYNEYIEGMKAIEERERRMKETHGMDWVAIRSDVKGDSLEVDIDARTRTVLKELDKTISFRNPFMDSAVLHVAPQRFPTTVLRLELERELDRLLREQIYERERASKFLVEDSSDSDAPGHTDDEDSDEDEDARVRNAETRRRERRAKMRANRAKEDVKVAKKRILMENKTPTEIAKAQELEALGFGGCLACKTNPCKWISNLDVTKVMKRKEQLADELNYIRKHPEMLVLDSQVALSAQRGGSTRFKRQDLVHELMWESRELERRMKLNGIDKELHDSYATRKEFMEVKVLHGYSTLLWTGNARRALEREHNKLVAITTASDVVDDILEWMLEGWYFGERESKQVVAGYVPSIKKDGFIKPGTETTKATAIKEEAERKKKAKAMGLLGGGGGGEGGGDGGRGELEEDKKEDDEQGTPWEKLVPIEVASKLRTKKEKAVKEGSDRDHVLNETEQTMKFGLFCLTFMYFRAMKMIRREKVSWEGAKENIGAEHAEGKRRHITAERKKMMEEERNEAARSRDLGKAMVKAKEGEERKKLRQEKERAEAAKKLYDKMRQEKMEKAAAVVLARVYRGHLGRKAARRWARKKAELEAMNALMNASAITIQRLYRGHKGRVVASEVRMEMAEFIAQIREEEAKQDEEEYWRTHAFQRYKRDVTAFVRTVAESVRSIKIGRDEGDDHDFS